jgi:hypothetical protein
MEDKHKVIFLIALSTLTVTVCVIWAAVVHLFVIR